MSEKIIEILKIEAGDNVNYHYDDALYAEIWYSGTLIESWASPHYIKGEGVKLKITFIHELNGRYIQHWIKKLPCGTVKYSSPHYIQEVERIPITTYEYKPVEG